MLSSRANDAHADVNGYEAGLNISLRPLEEILYFVENPHFQRKEALLLGYTIAAKEPVPPRHAKSEGRSMRGNIRGILVVSALLGAVSLSAQTAADIVARNLAAVGGKDAISKVKSISMEMTTQMMGNEMRTTVRVLEGVASRSETEFNGGTIVQCYTDKGGWIVNPAAGINDPTPMPDDQYLRGKSQIYAGGDLYDYAAKGSKVDLLAKDANTYTVKLTTKDNLETTYVFDSSTYLVKSMNFKGKIQDQDVDVTTSFSDYRKTDAGFMTPYAMSVDFGGHYSLDITVNQFEVNKAVDPEICALPKSGATAPVK